MSHSAFLSEILDIYKAARESDDGQICAVAPHPDLRARMDDAVKSMKQSHGFDETFVVKLAEPKADGLNDGTIYPPDQFPVGTAPSVIRSAAADRAPLRGALRVIVVLVVFTDKPMSQTANHFKDLFFSQGVLPTKSVREYYHEVTNGLIDIQGDVVGPFRMPQTLATYAHGAAGLLGCVVDARLRGVHIGAVDDGDAWHVFSPVPVCCCLAGSVSHYAAGRREKMAGAALLDMNCGERRSVHQRARGLHLVQKLGP